MAMMQNFTPRNTRYWVKRDIRTFKRAFRSTLKYSLLIFLLSAITSMIISFINLKTFEFSYVRNFTLAIYLISSIGYFLFYIIAKKGYDTGVSG